MASAWCCSGGPSAPAPIDRAGSLLVMTRSATGDNGLSDDLTNSQIALLCDIGEFDPPKLTSDQKRDLERLVFGGYVEPTENHVGSAFALTAKGLEFLGQRGATL